MASRVLLLNGPNLNLLGSREPDIYGRETLEQIRGLCETKAAELDLALDFRQSNSEGELVTWIQEARERCRGLILNPAAYTHTSIAILDALQLCDLPVIELHLSNPAAREPFRHYSFVSAAVRGIICGFGSHGYTLALEAMSRILREEDET